MPQQSDQSNDIFQGRRVYWLSNLFWTVIFYLSLGFSLFVTFSDTPDRVQGWSGVALFATLAAFCGVYHALYLRFDNWWPMPPRRALIYFTTQIVLLAVLVWFNPFFSGIGYALIAHACMLLPWRQWFLPLAGIVVIIGWSYNILDGNWVGLATFAFSLAVIIGTLTGVSVLTQQRWQLANLVGELRQAQTELEASRAQAEELAALRERTRLAREMHDSLGHALVLVNVKLEAAQRLYRKDMARGDAELEATRALVRETMADLRRSLADLRAPLPDHANLPAALQSIADDLQARTNLDVRVEAEPVDALPPATSETIWRVAREAAVNIERHAAAASATLSLARRNGDLLLRVVDDGSGIRPADLAMPGHFGITGMRERVESLGGTLRVSASPSGGTIVEARVPLVEQHP